MEQANLVNLKRKTRYTAVFLGLLLALSAITVLNINIGSVPIPVSKIAKIIFTGEGDARQVAIIWKIRLPRILMAAILCLGIFALPEHIKGHHGEQTLPAVIHKAYHGQQQDAQHIAGGPAAGGGNGVLASGREGYGCVQRYARRQVLRCCHELEDEAGTCVSASCRRRL